MKSCFFTSKNKQGRSIQGKVTLKNDGKTSISLFNAKYGTSYADRYQAKLLAQQIVEADFNHPAAENIETDENRKGLISKLTKETQDLKEAYLKTVENWATKNYILQESRKTWKAKDWVAEYGEHEEKSKYHGFLTKKVNIRLTRAKTEMMNVTYHTKENYVRSEITSAKRHYENSIEKLAARLNSKGVSDDTELKITKSRIDINLEMIIEHNGIITKAWTIVAEGMIQRPHYRYLVK